MNNDAVEHDMFKTFQDLCDRAPTREDHTELCVKYIKAYWERRGHNIEIYAGLRPVAYKKYGKKFALLSHEITSDLVNGLPTGGGNGKNA